MRTRLVVVGFTAVTALLVAGCGDDGGITMDRSGGARSTTTVAPGDQGTTPDDQGTDGTIGTVPGGIGSIPGMEDGCLALAQAISAATQAMASGSSSEEVQAQIESARSQVPEEIRDDFDTFVSVYDQLVNEGLGAAGEQLGTDKFTEAGQKLTEYMTKHCGIPGG